MAAASKPNVDTRRRQPGGRGGYLREDVDGGSQLLAIAGPLSKLASSMAYLTICPPRWRCTGTRDRDVVSDRCAAERAALGTASQPANVLVRLVLGLVGFGPRCTSSLIG